MLCSRMEALNQRNVNFFYFWFVEALLTVFYTCANLKLKRTFIFKKTHLHKSPAIITFKKVDNFTKWYIWDKKNKTIAYTFKSRH